jgi:hypothetical protein
MVGPAISGTVLPRGASETRMILNADITEDTCSLLFEPGALFPAKKFPALDLGNFAAKALALRCRVGPVNAKIDGIPYIFPRIREPHRNRRRAVRLRLPAQPTSHGFSGSLPAFCK